MREDIKETAKQRIAIQDELNEKVKEWYRIMKQQNAMDAQDARELENVGAETPQTQQTPQPPIDNQAKANIE